MNTDTNIGAVVRLELVAYLFSRIVFFLKFQYA